MILDRLTNADRHVAAHDGFARAWAFLRQDGVNNLPAGRHEVDGERVYAVVSEDRGRGPGSAKLESHRKYIDIQFVVSGRELIGWRDLSRDRSGGLGYDADRDIEFFAGSPETWFVVPPGSFVVLFPDDAHAPLAGEGPVRKIVMKVAVGGRREKAC
jgi:biofilm protein TabA